MMATAPMQFGLADRVRYCPAHGRVRPEWKPGNAIPRCPFCGDVLVEEFDFPKFFMPQHDWITAVGRA